jgi:hypothetical protein
MFKSILLIVVILIFANKTANGTPATSDFKSKQFSSLKIFRLVV